MIHFELYAMRPSEAAMEIECVGKIFGNGQILINPSLIDQAEIGSTINLKITVPDQKEKKAKKELSPATKRLLKRMENAKPLGVPDDPQEISHSRLMEERMDEKFPREGSYESDISEALLSVAEEDWHDLADPEEDMYDEYKA